MDRRYAALYICIAIVSVGYDLYQTLHHHQHGYYLDEKDTESTDGDVGSTDGDVGSSSRSIGSSNCGNAVHVTNMVVAAVYALGNP